MRVETEEDLDAEEDILYYEKSWAASTSAHGFARVVATTRIQRVFWILALLGTFILCQCISV